MLHAKRYKSKTIIKHVWIPIDRKWILYNQQCITTKAATSQAFQEKPGTHCLHMNLSIYKQWVRWKGLGTRLPQWLIPKDILFLHLPLHIFMMEVYYMIYSKTKPLSCKWLAGRKVNLTERMKDKEYTFLKPFLVTHVVHCILQKSIFLHWINKTSSNSKHTMAQKSITQIGRLSDIRVFIIMIYYMNSYLASWGAWMSPACLCINVLSLSCTQSCW